jgi:diguanylate cyclase (GGDEF)-like protein/PAS domain S-box-containing protein
LNIFHLFPFFSGIRNKTALKTEHNSPDISEESLRRSEERYRSILTSMEDGYFEVDLAGNMLFSNEANDRIFGYTRGEQIGMNYREYTDPKDVKRVFEIYNQVYRTGVPHKGFEWVVIKRNGEKVYVETSVSLILDSHQQPIGFRGILRDITRQKETEAALRQSEERYRTIVENIEDGYFEVDIAGNMIFCNEAHCRIYGYSRDELNGLNYRQYLDKENAKKVYEIYNKVFQTGVPEKVVDFELIRKDGSRIFVSASVSLIRDSKGQKIGFRGILRDVTQQKLAEEALKAMSLIDDLTGLYNRRGFLTLAEQELKVAQRLERGMFLLFADMDDLKVINDTFGHLEGDRALMETARIIKENFRDPDIIARIGGDEFVILAIEGASEAGPDLLTERLRGNLVAYNNTESDRKYRLSLSFGAVAYDPKNPMSIDMLLSQADKNMYEEKQGKKKNTQLSLKF